VQPEVFGNLRSKSMALSHRENFIYFAARRSWIPLRLTPCAFACSGQALNPQKFDCGHTPRVFGNLLCKSAVFSRRKNSRYSPKASSCLCSG
ncbi:MAG: hypothetical protein IJY43_03585, partial [Clostridia bacterium]|nr:hypothetical protein [Clostridia bacterium]